MNLDLGPRPLSCRRILLLLVGLLAAAGGTARTPKAVAGETSPAPPDSLGTIDPGTPGGSLFTGFS